ncbi:MAG: extracellular solute-binding protein [Roseburia sp.]|nr:extracellular solute-binding protein [Roseburia sp.]
MKKKLLSLLMVGAMTATVFAGCGGSDSSSDTGAANDTASDNAADKADDAAADDKADDAAGDSAAEGGKTLTVWCWDPAFNIFAMNEAAKVYQKDHPDVTVDVIETPWEDVQTKLTTAATSGALDTLPDILLMQDNAFQKNVITFPDAFTDLTNSGVDFSNFAAGKTAYSVIDGKNYGVPFDNGAVIACYRTDILEQAGLTLDDFTDITFDQYIENGKKVLDATGKPLISMQAGECDLIMMMMQSAGASLFNEDGTANISGNDTLKIVMETYKELKESGVLIEVNSWDEYISSMTSETVAGTINGCWIMASIQTAADQSGKWGITNMPSLVGASGATNYSNNGGSSWAVTSNCQDTELAFDFLASTFAGSTELYDNIISSGALATYAPAGGTDAYAAPNDFFGGDAVSSKIVEFSTKVPSNITGVYYYEGRDAVATAVTNVINGGDIDAELETAAATINSQMQ